MCILLETLSWGVREFGVSEIWSREWWHWGALIEVNIMVPFDSL